jgi:hypothetical protein
MAEGEARRMGTGATKANSLESGQGLVDFQSGFSRRRGGIEGRFGGNGVPGNLKGTFYRESMPSPIAGAAPQLNSFAGISGRGQGVNFFGYGQAVKATEQGAKEKIYRGSSEGDATANDSFRGESKITGFSTKISRGMSTWTDYGNNNPASAANGSFYRAGGGTSFDTERYQDWMKSLVATQGSGMQSQGAKGVLGNERQGVQ